MEKTLRQKFNNQVEKYGNKFYNGLGDILTTDVNKKGALELGLAGVIGLGSAGCGPMRTYQTEQIHGYDFKNQTQNDSPYKEERIILHGQEFYVQRREPNDWTELPFEFLPFDKVLRVINLDTKFPNERVKLESEERYIPKKVESPGTMTPLTRFSTFVGLTCSSGFLTDLILSSSQTLRPTLLCIHI